MAESKGFEPLVPLGTRDFESRTFDHSDSSPRRKLAKHFGVSTAVAWGVLGSNCRKKLAQKCAALVRKNTRYTFEAVVEAFVATDAVESLGGASFWIIATPDDAGDAGVHEGACAHRAGLEGDVESGVDEAPAAELLGGFSNCEHLRVCGRVLGGFTFVVAASYDLAFVDDERADRDFAFGLGETCLSDGRLHPLLVRGIGGHRLPCVSRYQSASSAIPCSRVIF